MPLRRKRSENRHIFCFSLGETNVGAQRIIDYGEKMCCASKPMWVVLYMPVLFIWCAERNYGRKRAPAHYFTTCSSSNPVEAYTEGTEVEAKETTVCSEEPAGNWRDSGKYWQIPAAYQAPKLVTD